MGGATWALSHQHERSRLDQVTEVVHKRFRVRSARSHGWSLRARRSTGPPTRGDKPPNGKRPASPPSDSVYSISAHCPSAGGGHPDPVTGDALSLEWACARSLWQ